MNLTDIIKTTDDKISDALNDLTKASWNAGLDAAYEIAAAKADAVAAVAKTDAGRGAAEHIAREIRKIRDEVKEK